MLRFDNIDFGEIVLLVDECVVLNHRDINCQSPYYHQNLFPIKTHINISF
jgi:hypothetical protein